MWNTLGNRVPVAIRRELGIGFVLLILILKDVKKNIGFQAGAF